MSTPRTYARRLRKLADYLEQKVAPAVKKGRVRWNMHLWAEKPPKPELNCGTAACAAGYATNIFHRQGLILEHSGGQARFGDFHIVYRRPGKRATKFGRACKAFFGTIGPFDPIYYDVEPTIPVVVARLREEADAMTKKEASK